MRVLVLLRTQVLIAANYSVALGHRQFAVANYRPYRSSTPACCAPLDAVLPLMLCSPSEPARWAIYRPAHQITAPISELQVRVYIDR